MSAATKRRTTLAFRSFRKKNTVLSEIHWTSELGRHAARSLLAKSLPTAKAATEINAAFDPRHLGESVTEFTRRMDERAGTERLHLLVMCSANLESFLQDAVELFVADQGHRTKDFRLSLIGKQIAQPVIRSSTIPDMLEYTESLLDVKFGSARSSWKTAYKLRCAAAHEAGVLTAETRTKLGDNRRHVGDWIRLTWPDLKRFLESAYSIADAVDRRISTASLRSLEVEWLLARWKREETLPTRDRVWTAVHELGISVQRPRQKAIEAWLY